MALEEIRAKFACDGCGCPFSVRVDPAWGCPPGWTCFDVAENTVRGSCGYEGPATPEGFLGMSSVQGGRHLCGVCTRVADARSD